jgi:CRP/FNR family transcriptional regulator, cyclic AMP receptor protein
LIPKCFSPRWARVSEQGKEAVIAILGPGHFFGEGCLNGHPLRIATTRAVDECVVTRLEKATMVVTIHNEPEFSELFMSYLLTRNTRIEEDLIDQLFNSSEKRLARLLLLLARADRGNVSPAWVPIHQSRNVGRSGKRMGSFDGRYPMLDSVQPDLKLAHV